MNLISANRVSYAPQSLRSASRIAAVVMVAIWTVKAVFNAPGGGLSS